MTRADKAEFSPKKGKENTNLSNQMPPKDPDVKTEDEEESFSTSKRSVRPQTKVLRRPTPNLQHPVIQVDSDDGSSCSDKSKEDNPKRLKTGEEAACKTPKNFVAYNRDNVDKNTKNAARERNLSATIPDPCNSCSRSQAPERLHSHAKKDARGLMMKTAMAGDISMASPRMDAPADVPEDGSSKGEGVRSSPSQDVKMTSPRKAASDESSVKSLLVKRSPSLDVKMASPRKEVSEDSSAKSHLVKRSPSLDVKMASPKKNIREDGMPKMPLVKRSPSFNVKMALPIKHISKDVPEEGSLKALSVKKSPPVDVKMASPTKGAPADVSKVVSFKELKHRLVKRSPSFDVKVASPKKDRKCVYEYDKGAAIDSTDKSITLRDAPTNKLTLTMTKEVKTLKGDEKDSIRDIPKKYHLSKSISMSKVSPSSAQAKDAFLGESFIKGISFKEGVLKTAKECETKDSSMKEILCKDIFLTESLIKGVSVKDTFIRPNRFGFRNMKRNARSKCDESCECPSDVFRESCGCPVDVARKDVLVRSQSQSQVKELENISKPCYICNEEFKVTALLLHESRCLENWRRINNALTPNLRQLPPRRPTGSPPHPDLSSGSEEDEMTSSAALEPCPLCGRTFFPERLPVHVKVCKAAPSKNAARTAEEPEYDEKEEEEGAAEYAPCTVCGRRFGSWVLALHQRQCSGRLLHEGQSPGSSPEEEEAAELGATAWESHLQQLVPCPMCARTFFPDRLGVHTRSCKGRPAAIKRPTSNRGS